MRERFTRSTLVISCVGHAVLVALAGCFSTALSKVQSQAPPRTPKRSLLTGPEYPPARATSPLFHQPLTRNPNLTVLIRHDCHLLSSRESYRYSRLIDAFRLRQSIMVSCTNMLSIRPTTTLRGMYDIAVFPWHHVSSGRYEAARPSRALPAMNFASCRCRWLSLWTTYSVQRLYTAHAVRKIRGSCVHCSICR
jgi:hypothetical protein